MTWKTPKINLYLNISEGNLKFPVRTKSIIRKLVETMNNLTE